MLHGHEVNAAHLSSKFLVFNHTLRSLNAYTDATFSLDTYLDNQTQVVSWYRVPNWYQIHYSTSDFLVFNGIIQEALYNCVVTAMIKKEHLIWFGHICLIWDLFTRVSISTVTDSICWIWAFGARGKGLQGTAWFITSSPSQSHGLSFHTHLIRRSQPVRLAAGH